MQTNLDSMFKTDSEMESEGIEFVLSPKIKFRLRRFGGMNSPKVKAALAKFYKPYSAQMNAGTLDQKTEQEINAKVFADACLVGWDGIEIDGKPVTYSRDAAIKLFSGLPDLMGKLMEYCSNAENYREDLGNS